MGDSSMDLIKVRIQQEYEQEVAEAKQRAKTRMEQKLESAAKIFGDATPELRKPRASGGVNLRTFGSGELQQAVVDELRLMTIGTKFTAPMLHEQMVSRYPDLHPAAVGNVFNRAFRGTKMQMDNEMSIKLRSMLVEKATQMGGTRKVYEYERIVSTLVGGPIS